jgi:hypothetical protein
MNFFVHAATLQPRRIYTDGSFTVIAPLLDALSMSTVDLTHAHGQAATGVYLSHSQGAEALALIVCTPSLTVTDAYYKELLGTTISMLLPMHAPLISFSDCSFAIHNLQDATGPLHTGPSGGSFPTWCPPSRPSLVCRIPQRSRGRHPTQSDQSPNTTSGRIVIEAYTKQTR